MAGELSTVGAANALDGALGRATQTARTTYIALLTAAPTDASTLASMTEVAVAGYSRQSVTWTAPSGDPSETHNSAVITFGPLTGDSPSITHAAVVSAASGTTGDLIAWWSLTTARDPAINDSVQISASAASLSLD